VDLNLDTLKLEILEYLESVGFAVFHGSPGGLEGMPMVLWDSERHPDYRMFLDVAQKCGTKLVIFGSREFENEAIDELVAQLDDCDLDHEERRDYESRLRKLRPYAGVTCVLELAFDYDSRLYVYEVQPDWYEEFMGIDDEITERMAGPDEEEDLPGGYFSNN
jgi:hypothetical protein